MYLFLSFVVALISLYYLGVMVDTYNPDTTYLTPLVALLIYSILSIIRSLRKESISWLTYEDDYGTYNGGNRTYNNSSNQYNYAKWDYQYGSKYTPKSVNEKTEYFTPDKKEKNEDNNQIVYYPSRRDVREKIKELEKSRWFRIKRNLYSLVFIDLTERYREEFKKPYKINRKGKVVSVNQNVNKEDHSRFVPSNNYWANKEKEEYNSVAKLMGKRSCEIALTEEEYAVLVQGETNNQNNDEQK